MHRIDTDGATVGFLFTEGNPGLNIPATVVGADWLNDTVQEELVLVVENAGLTLSKPDNTQLQQALNIQIASGGGGTGAVVTQAIANNQAAAAVVAGLSFNSVTEKAASMLFSLVRRTDTPAEQFNEVGEIRIIHDAENSLWKIDWSSSFDDAGVTFSITAGGQIEYVSTNLAGASYAGELKVNNIRKIFV